MPRAHVREGVANGLNRDLSMLLWWSVLSDDRAISFDTDDMARTLLDRTVQKAFRFGFCGG